MTHDNPAAEVAIGLQFFIQSNPSLESYLKPVLSGNQPFSLESCSDALFTGTPDLSPVTRLTQGPLNQSGTMVDMKNRKESLKTFQKKF